MVDGNGSGDGTEVIKMCPFFKEWCDKEHQNTCALHAELTQSIGGLQRKMTLCVFNAMIMMLSEINMKTPAPQQKIQRINLPPNLGRG